MALEIQAAKHAWQGVWVCFAQLPWPWKAPDPGLSQPVCHSCLWDGQAGLSAHTKQEVPKGSLPMPVAVLSGPWTPLPNGCSVHPLERFRGSIHIFTVVPLLKSLL